MSCGAGHSMTAFKRTGQENARRVRSGYLEIRLDTNVRRAGYINAKSVAPSVTSDALVQDQNDENLTDKNFKQADATPQDQNDTKDTYKSSNSSTASAVPRRYEHATAVLRGITL